MPRIPNEDATKAPTLFISFLLNPARAPALTLLLRDDVASPTPHWPLPLHFSLSLTSSHGCPEVEKVTLFSILSGMDIPTSCLPPMVQP